MVCGEFGSPSLAPHGKTIGFLNAVLCIMGVAFGIVGCVSYTNNFDALANAPWALSTVEYIMPGYESTLYAANGIRSFTYYMKNDDGNKKSVTLATAAAAMSNEDGVITFENCVDVLETAYTSAVLEANVDLALTSGYERCDKCDKASVAVVTMCSFALIAAAVAFLAQIMRVTCDSTFAKDIAILAGTSAFVFGCISWSVYLPCAMALRDYAEHSNVDESGFGVGAKLVLGSFVAAIIVTIFTLVTPVMKEEEAVATDDVTKV